MRVFRILLACILLACITVPSSASIIGNGGFNSDLNTHHSAPASPWVIGDGGTPLAPRVVIGAEAGLAPFEGDGYLAFVGPATAQRGFAYQDVTVAKDVTYLLSFQYGGRSAPNPVTASVELTVRGILDPGGSDTDLFTPTQLSLSTFGVWTSEAITFQALADGDLRIHFQETSANSNGRGIGVDAVSLTAVPEPSTLAMFSAGLLALALAGFRKKTNRTSS